MKVKTDKTETAIKDPFCVVLFGYLGAYRYAPTDLVSASMQLAGMPLCVCADLMGFTGWVKRLPEVKPLAGTIADKPRKGREWRLIAVQFPSQN